MTFPGTQTYPVIWFPGTGDLRYTRGTDCFRTVVTS